jgi:hypothetical protein
MPKITTDSSASTGRGINGMARSVLFFSFILLISISLASLYIFGFSQLFIAVLSLTTLFIVYLLFHPRNQWLVANRSRVDGARCVALTFDDGPRSGAVDWAQVDRFLASADEKLASAHRILAFDEEACLQQAYEGNAESFPRVHVQRVELLAAILVSGPPATFWARPASSVAREPRQRRMPGTAPRPSRLRAGDLFPV